MRDMVDRGRGVKTREEDNEEIFMCLQAMADKSANTVGVRKTFNAAGLHHWLGGSDPSWLRIFASFERFNDY